MIYAVVLLVGVLGGVTLVFGGVIAAVVVLWARDVATATTMVSNGFAFLSGVLPLALWFALHITHRRPECRTAYQSVHMALLTVLQGAVIGSVLGAGPLFMAVVINVPGLLAAFEVDELSHSVRTAIEGWRLWLAVGATVLAALPLGLWVHYIGAEEA
jgi:glucan phosphoethanolaminetransferase (alkaline phosphatase superfamily)